MRAQHWTGAMLAVASALVGAGRTATADEGMGPMSMARGMNELKLGAFPAIPTCFTGAVESGDPSKGASVLFAKAQAGCVIPWHWHTATEQVIVVAGAGRMDMKDGKPATLKAGGFAFLPSKHVHQFTCMTSCSLFIVSDVPFDIHYVDAKGNEITPDAALKALKEKAGGGPT